MTILIAAAALALLPAAPAVQAQDASASCAAMNAALPSVWAAWSQTQPLGASTTASNASAISPGHAYAVTLNPAAQVALNDDKHIKPDTFAGYLGLDVTQAGTYTIALDQAAWVDVIGRMGMARSSGHQHGVACSSIRKTVDFQLEPGHYTLRIANAGREALTLEAQPK